MDIYPIFLTAMVKEYVANLAEKGIVVAKTVIDTYSQVILLRLLDLNSFPTNLHKNETAAICNPVTIEMNSEEGSAKITIMSKFVHENRKF